MYIQYVGSEQVTCDRSATWLSHVLQIMCSLPNSEIAICRYLYLLWSANDAIYIQDSGERN